MLQLENKTPFEAGMFLFPDEQGLDTLYVVLKATFAMAEKIAVAEKQVPVSAADAYWQEPGESSLRYASEAHLAKPGTDVVLVGTAQAPGRQEVDSLYATVSVAERDKTIHVVGDREWTGALIPPLMTHPEPFETMPLVWERAYGGVHAGGAKDDQALYEPRNPVGCGFTGKRKRKELQGLPLPNLEDIASPLQEPGEEQAPSCFGFVAPSWEPRRSFAGTYDETWQKKRAPYLPEDFDPRFFNAAHPDLCFDRYLEGGEPVELENVSARGPLKFVLPRCGIAVAVRLAGREEKPPVNLETVLFEPDESRLIMTWRGAVPCDKKALKVERVDIALQSMDVEPEME